MSQDKEREAWRDLALQFDGHRMQALGWLRLIAKELPKNPDWADLYHFLASPPLSGEAVLAERIAALASQQAGKGEPFCYHHQLVLNDSSGIIDSDTNSQPTMEPWLSGCRVETIPLYASPPSREPLTEWEARGMLARLKCWHRLTEQEADELVQFAMQGGIHSRGEGVKA